MKFIIVVAALLAVASAAPLFAAEPAEAEALFAKWQERYNKQYSNGEYQTRLAAFTDNVAFVKSHNKEYELGIQTYKVALNEFADMTLQEFVAQRNGFKYNANAARNEVALNGTAPESVDWRTKGAVTPVKNQGQCGSCWAFSTTGSLEAANFLKTGNLVSFAEQELVDCDNVDQGCNGGLMDNAFQFVEQNGLTEESNYKYTAMDGQCNQQAEKKAVATCSGYTDVPKSDEDQLALAVAKQPVSVAIEADQSGFQLYHSGVFSGECGTQLDHGVLAVGYGTENGQDYWLVKNSWGASWGDSGYIKLAKGTKGPDGQCGITLSASYPQA